MSEQDLPAETNESKPATPPPEPPPIRPVVIESDTESPDQVRERRELAIFAKFHQGPLPPTEYLEKLNQIIPGAAARLFETAMRQSEARVTNENKIVDANIEARKLGMYLGALLSGSAIVGGCIVAALGQGVAGASIAGTFALALATAYLTAVFRQQREMKKKRETIEEIKGKPNLPKESSQDETSTVHE